MCVCMCVCVCVRMCVCMCVCVVNKSITISSPYYPHTHISLTVILNSIFLVLFIFLSLQEKLNIRDQDDTLRIEMLESVVVKVRTARIRADICALHMCVLILTFQAN